MGTDTSGPQITMSTDLTSPEFARDMARWRRERKQTDPIPATTPGNGKTLLHTVGGFTWLWHENNFGRFKAENTNHYNETPREYPCLVRAIFDANEETQYIFLYREDIAAILGLFQEADADHAGQAGRKENEQPHTDSEELGE